MNMFCQQKYKYDKSKLVKYVSIEVSVSYWNNQN